MMAVLHTGLPQTGDPDAAVHWTILGVGFSGLLTASVLFSSCRVIPRLLALAGRKSPFENLFFRSIYRYHVYFWSILLIAVLAHFLVSYQHAGVWPGPAN